MKLLYIYICTECIEKSLIDIYVLNLKQKHLILQGVLLPDRETLRGENIHEVKHY